MDRSCLVGAVRRCGAVGGVWVSVLAMSVLVGLGLLLAIAPRTGASNVGGVPPIDPAALFSSAAHLNTNEANALAAFLQSPGWAVVRRPTEVFEWSFTGFAVPIGAYSAGPGIGADAGAVPDGIYWVTAPGHLLGGPDAIPFAAGDLLVVGSAFNAGDEEQNTCQVRCREGYFACCGQSSDGNQPIFCRCLQNGSSTASCQAGGTGASSCEISKKEVGGKCGVTCDANHYACCSFPGPNGPPRCVCVPNGTQPPPNCSNGGEGSEMCTQTNPNLVFLGSFLVPVVEPGEGDGGGN